MRVSVSWLLPSLLFFSLGCTGDATEVIIEVTPSAAIKSLSTSLTVRVSDPSGQQPDPHPATGHAWNRAGTFIIGLTPKDEGQAESFRVDVVANGPTGALGWARVESSYVDGKRRYLTLAIEDSCPYERVCGEGLTCRAGACVPAYIPPEALGASVESAPSTATFVPSDAGVISSDGTAPAPPPWPADGGPTPASPSSDAYVPPAVKADGAAPSGPMMGLDWRTQLQDAGLLPAPDAARPDASITVSRCFTRDVFEDDEELYGDEMLRIHNAVGFCFATTTTSCFDLLGIATDCSLPLGSNSNNFSKYTLWWSTNTGVATAQASRGGDAGVQVLGTATPQSSGIYRISTVLPWAIRFPADAGSLSNATATCEIDLYEEPSYLDDSTGAVTLCLPVSGSQ